MKEIGEKLKKSREEAGLSLEEVSEDLKLEFKKLQLIEEGNKEAFNDIYDLKYCIRDYAKYLGLDYEQLVDDFNEFVFEYTSKIPIAAIQEASKEIEKEAKTIASPYTMEKNIKSINNTKKMILVTVALLFISLIIFVLVVNN